jgi:hypothetical protein
LREVDGLSLHNHVISSVAKESACEDQLAFVIHSENINVLKPAFKTVFKAAKHS